MSSNEMTGPEAELPRIEDLAEGGETYAAGSTPTKTGNWVTELLVKPTEITQA